jgi:cob(I)alamin adenosyltransferase
MKIYTRAGDKGKTSLVGGKRVPKTHIRIEAYGTVDELIAHIGMIRDMTLDASVKEYLLGIQARLMKCAAILASDCEADKSKIPEIGEQDIESLENAIDAMDSDLPPLTSFVIPGGHVAASQSHIARTVCRRAERQIIRLSEELFVPDTVIRYMNRLSDYLFVLSRKLLHDMNINDILWLPKL